MRPNQLCIFLLTLSSLALLLPQSLRCREQVELKLKEQIPRATSGVLLEKEIFKVSAEKLTHPKWPRSISL